jgi:hypothetical protein
MSYSLTSGTRPVIHNEPANNGLLRQQGLDFVETTYLSNGRSSLQNSITDFLAYNPYIHHQNLTGSTGGLLADIGSLGNVAPQATTINVMQNIVLASNRFELYNRTYRNQNGTNL